MGYYYYSERDCDPAPRSVRVNLASVDNDGNPWPDALEEFIGWLRELAEDAPDNADVRVSFTGGGWDDDRYANLEVYYDRPETPEEINKRVAHNEALRQAALMEKERQERAALAALKAKYEA